ncbi:MAG TPA: molecular chaperone TorD family protein [Myxococcaceae bacterium]|nr:molecular chaperone TorD family protein [Myxococcaceae bacterium]
MSAQTSTPTPSRLRSESALYAIAARLLLPPTEELLEALRSGDLQWTAEACAEALGGGELTGAARALGGAWTAAPAASLDELAAQHERAYGQACTGDRSPYELMYGGTTPFREPQDLADLMGYYAAFHLQLAGGAHDRPDHAGVEAEFLAYLLYLEAFALERGMAEQAEIAAEAARAFLRDHLAGFAAPFARKVAETAPAGAPREAARLLAALAAHHCDRLGVQRAERRFVPLQDPDADPELQDGGMP